MFEQNLWTRQLKVTPTGSQTLSKMPSRYVEPVYPKLLKEGYGSVVYDYRNKSYIDLIAGLGAISVGYCNDEIHEVILEQLDKGISFSLPTPLEADVAEKLVDLLPFTEQWKFCKTGTEVCMAAVKVARAVTGRDKIISLGYHGWSDIFECAGVRRAGTLKDNLPYIAKVNYNAISWLTALDREEYACVIMEPYVFDMPVAGFIEAIAEKCRKTKTLLIFDEVVTGGRTSRFAACNLFKVEPDLVLLSKGIGNGFPISAVGGKKSIMSTFEREDFFVSGTFGGECLSLAACLKTLEILERSIAQMILKGMRIKEKFNSLFFNTPAVCKGYPTRLTFDFPTPEHKALWMQEMCLNGVLTGYSNMTMADTTETDVQVILTAIDKSHKNLTENWSDPVSKLKGRLPVETLRLR